MAPGLQKDRARLLIPPVPTWSLRSAAALSLAALAARPTASAAEGLALAAVALVVATLAVRPPGAPTRSA